MKPTLRPALVLFALFSVLTGILYPAAVTALAQGLFPRAATSLRDDPMLLPAVRADLLEAICEEADRLERLVGNLLDMTRVESGGLHVRREWVPLEEVVGAALTRLEKALAGRAITTAIETTLPLVPVDPVLLEQVFINLLENAAKYTPPKSPIEIRAFPTAGGVDVEVLDRGPGFPPGDELRIFEKFYRGAHIGVGGVGLGLPICRGILVAHGGTLLAENRQGGGARFLMHLPIVGEAPPLDEGPQDATGEAPPGPSRGQSSCSSKTSRRCAASSARRFRPMGFVSSKPGRAPRESRSRPATTPR